MSNLGIRGSRIVTRMPTGRARLDDASARKRIVLLAAYEIAQKIGIAALNWHAVVEKCEVSTSVTTAKRAFDFSINELRREVANRAHQHRNRKLIEEGKLLGFLD
jgi:hypothetical protein